MEWKEDAPARQIRKRCSSAALETPADASTKTSKDPGQLLKMLCVLFGVLCEILRQIHLGIDRICWANRNASAAINAVHWIDKELRDFLELGFVFPRMNAVHRTNLDAFLILCTPFNDYE
jgi:hypothetical protein